MSEAKKDRVPEFAYLIPFDLETTGLNEQGDAILEVGARFGRLVDGVWSDRDSETFQRTLAVDPLDIPKWHQAVLEMHAKNGLMAESTKLFRGGARPSYQINDIDHALAKKASLLAPEGVNWTLLGNSVHFDLRFVRRLFPNFAKRLTHRCYDMSSIRMFCESLGMPYPEFPVAHRAVDDLNQSLDLQSRCREFVLQTQSRAIAPAAGLKFE